MRLIGDIFLSTRKTYHGLRCTISRNYHGRCCCDDLLGQNLLNHLRSWGWGAGLKHFILSPILLKCHGDAEGILCGHCGRVKFVNLGPTLQPLIHIPKVQFFVKFGYVYMNLRPYNRNIRPKMRGKFQVTGYECKFHPKMKFILG